MRSSHGELPVIAKSASAMELTLSSPCFAQRRSRRQRALASWCRLLPFNLCLFPSLDDLLRDISQSWNTMTHEFLFLLCSRVFPALSSL